MRKPLEARAGLGRAWAGLATARGGPRGGASLARARRGCWGALQATIAGLKGESGMKRSSPRLDSAGTAHKVRRRRVWRRSSAWWSRTGRRGASSAFLALRIGVRGPCEGATGVSGHGAEPGAWDCGGGPAHLRRRPAQNHRLHGSGSRLRPGEAPGAQAKLPRWLGLAVERRSSAGRAAQGLCAAMAWWSGVLGFGAAAAMGMRCRGGRGSHL